MLLREVVMLIGDGKHVSSSDVLGAVNDLKTEFPLAFLVALESPFGARADTLANGETIDDVLELFLQVGTAAGAILLDRQDSTSLHVNDAKFTESGLFVLRCAKAISWRIELFERLGVRIGDASALVLMGKQDNLVIPLGAEIGLGEIANWILECVGQAAEKTAKKWQLEGAAEIAEKLALVRNGHSNAWAQLRNASEKCFVKKVTLKRGGRVAGRIAGNQQFQEALRGLFRTLFDGGS